MVFRHSHIGRVTAVRNGYVYTNEGNTSALYGDSNGGTVKTKKYRIGESGKETWTALFGNVYDRTD